MWAMSCFAITMTPLVSWSSRWTIPGRATPPMPLRRPWQWNKSALTRVLFSVPAAGPAHTARSSQEAVAGLARVIDGDTIDIDGVRANVPGGWGLVRASNTQAVIVLRFEADTEAGLAAIQKEVKGVLQQAINRLGAA